MNDDKRDSQVIIDPKKLNVSSKALKVAEEILNQMDMPVVFLLSSDGDKNYAYRHPYTHNEFWVTVQPQTEQSEYERILLANLYRGLREKLRYSGIYLKKDCERKLLQEGNGRKCQQMQELLSKINAFVSTVDTECFLEEKMFYVSDQVKLKKFQACVMGLEEFLHKQRENPGFFWYKEVEICNLLEIISTIRFDVAYEKKLKNLILQIQPKERGALDEKLVTKGKRILDEFKQNRTDENAEECCCDFSEKLLSLFSLQDIMEVRPNFANAGVIELPSGEKVELYSFVPEEIEGEEELSESLKMINEGLVNLQKIYYTFKQAMPDVHVNIGFSNACNAYVYGTKLQGYHVAYLEGLIWKIRGKTSDISGIPKELISFYGETEICKGLQRAVFSLSILHECGHIMNGDCDQVEKHAEYDGENRSEVENAADRFAEKYLLEVLNLQYRPEPQFSIEAYRKLMLEIEKNKLLAFEAMHILRQIREETTN